MKKVTAFIGTSSKKATYQATQEFERNLKRYADVEFEYVFLDDYKLEYCRGCKLCFDKGEESCPLRDDRDALLEKMAGSDGVILATPNYAFHVTARMKNLLDRLAFIFHRPRFFGKTLTAIVTQGFYGGGAIRKYLEDTGENFGFSVTKGCYLTTLEPMTERQRESLSKKVREASERFYRGLTRPTPPPSLFRLMLFRMSRTNIRLILDPTYRDYNHYREQGWFESDYYYDTSLGPVRKLAGYLFDFLGRQMVRNR